MPVWFVLHMGWGEFFVLNLNFLFYGTFFLLRYMSKDFSLSLLKTVVLIALETALLFFVSFIYSSNIKIMQNLKFPPQLEYFLYSLICVTIVLFIKRIKYKLSENNIFERIGKKHSFFIFANPYLDHFYIISLHIYLSHGG